MLVRLLKFYYLFKLTFCIQLRWATCALNGEKLYLYGGLTFEDKQNKNIYSAKLEGLELENNRLKWNLEKANKYFPEMRNVKAYNLGNESNEILNFAGPISKLPFNILNVENYKIRNNTKGLKELSKILGMPNGLEKDIVFIYEFIQSDKDLSKFYLINSLIHSPKKKEKYINILMYNVLKDTWKDTGLLFNNLNDAIIVSYKDLIYGIKIPNLRDKSSYSYIINIEQSKVIKFMPKGDIPSKVSDSYHFSHENQVFYFILDEKNETFNLYVFNLDTLTWRKRDVKNLHYQSAPFIFYYKGYIIITLGGNRQDDNEYTQIIDVNTWNKVYSINAKKKISNSTVINNQVKDESNKDKNDSFQNNEKEGINKYALIGGTIGGAIFLGSVIIATCFYFKKRKEADFIKPPEYIVEHEIIDPLDLKDDSRSLTFRFSERSKLSKTYDEWDLKHPEVVYLMNGDGYNSLSK